MGLEYKELSTYRNQYPDSLETSIDTLSSTEFVHNGKLLLDLRTNQEVVKNTITYDLFDIDDIHFYNDTEIFVDSDEKLKLNFLVYFEDIDEYWTSQTFYESLQRAISDSNPYFNRNNVPIVKLNLQPILDFSEKEELFFAEKYAEVEIVDTIDSIKDILLHISWMVASAIDAETDPDVVHNNPFKQDGLRPERKNSDEDNIGIGYWPEPTPSDSLGAEYTEQLNEIKSR